VALLVLALAGPALARATPHGRHDHRAASHRRHVHHAASQRRHSHRAAVVVHLRSAGTYSVRVVVRGAARRRNRVLVRIGSVRRRAVIDRRHRRARIVVRLRIAGRWLTVRAVGHRARPVLVVALRRVARHRIKRHPTAPAPARPAPAPTPAPATPAATSTTAPAAPAPSAPVSAPSGASVYWGAWIGPQFTGTQAPWDQNAINDFEHDAGKDISVLNFSSPFGNCYSSPCTTYPFPAAQFTTVRDDGAIPFFSWATEALPTQDDPAAYDLSSIINGTWDSYITSWAEAAKAWGHPFFLRFDWEMNGNWFPWSEGVNGNQAGQFVAAWRHVHDIFTRVGATNAAWVWCPNPDPEHQFTPLTELYPGDQYVDWTCLDVYNFDQPWLTFSQLASSTYAQITQSIAPSKPMIIGETASTESGGSKAQWITDMFNELPTEFPDIHGLLWMDNNVDGHDWPIESSASATAAFAAGIASPRYAANSFGGLDGLSPVAAL
jgi:hypothetical protein